MKTNQTKLALLTKEIRARFDEAMPGQNQINGPKDYFAPRSRRSQI